jgi:kynurenine formamidase
MEIASYAADTLSSEQTLSSTTNTMVPLHIFLLNHLGIPIQEILWLEELADDCFVDKQYDFLYVCSPLKFIGGTGSPVNPLAIK